MIYIGSNYEDEYLYIRFVNLVKLTLYFLVLCMQNKSNHSILGTVTYFWFIWFSFQLNRRRGRQIKFDCLGVRKLAKRQFLRIIGFSF